MTILQPGLYRILPILPMNDSQKRDIGLPPSIIPPPTYATAPKETGGNVTLHVVAAGGERQVWRVNMVDEANLLYTIDYEDPSSSDEYPPAFGAKSDPADQVVISCIKGEKENKHQWKLVYQAQKPPFTSYAKYTVLPARNGSVVGGFFLNGRRSDTPEGGRIWINKQGSIPAHSWYFEPYVPPSAEEKK